MAQLTESAADFMFKKLYADGLPKDNLLRGKQLLQWMNHETDFTTHKGIEIPVPHTKPQGYGSTNANAAAAVTSSVGSSFVVPQRHVTQYGAIDGTVVRNAINGSNTSHFADAMEREVDGNTESLGETLNAASYGSSDGIRSYIAASGAINTTNLPLRNPEDAQLYEIGMRLQFINPANGALRTGGTGYVVVTKVNSITGNLTLSGTLNAEVTSVALGDGIIRWSMNNADLDGIRGWCPDEAVVNIATPYLGVDRSVYRTRLAGIYLDKSTMPVRSGILAALALAKGHVGKKFEKSAPWFANPKNIGQLRQTVEAGKFLTKAMEDKYGIGIDAFEVDGHTFIEDEHCPVDELILIGKEAFTRGSCGDQPYIDDSDGNKFNYARSGSNAGQLEFCLAHDGNTYSYQPWNIMRLKISSQAA